MAGAVSPLVPPNGLGDRLVSVPLRVGEDHPDHYYLPRLTSIGLLVPQPLSRQTPIGLILPLLVAEGAADTGVAAAGAYDDLVATLHHAGAGAATEHLRVAPPVAMTFLTHPQTGRLLVGDKGRPELDTGVLERVMREITIFSEKSVFAP